MSHCASHTSPCAPRKLTPASPTKMAPANSSNSKSGRESLHEMPESVVVVARPAHPFLHRRAGGNERIRIEPAHDQHREHDHGRPRSTTVAGSLRNQKNHITISATTQSRKPSFGCGCMRAGYSQPRRANQSFVRSRRDRNCLLIRGLLSRRLLIRGLLIRGLLSEGLLDRLDHARAFGRHG